MKFTINQSELKTTLNTVIRAVPSRPSHPILANILLTVKDNTLTAVGFDLSIGIRVKTHCEGINDGSVTVPAKLLADIINKAPEGEISIYYDGYSTITLKGQGVYKLRAIIADEYPELPTIKNNRTNDSFSSGNFLTALKVTTGVASQDDTKQILTGINIVSKPDLLELQATDGHRLAVIQTDEERTFDYSVVVPAKILREVERLITEKDSVVYFNYDDNMLCFQYGHIEIIGRVLDGGYPSVHNLIPTSFENTAIVDRQQLITAIERIAIFCTEKSKMIALEFTNNYLTVYSEVTELGEAKESFSCEFGDKQLKLGFNYSYLLNGLKIMDSKEVKFLMNQPTQPVILTPLSGMSLTYLVMPVNIK